MTKQSWLEAQNKLPTVANGNLYKNNTIFLY